MDRIKAYLFNAILENIQKNGKVKLPWFWYFLPSNWKSEFSALLLLALPITPVVRQAKTVTKPLRSRLAAGLVVAALILVLGGSYSMLLNDQNKHAGEPMRSLTATSQSDQYGLATPSAATLYTVYVPPEQSANAVQVIESLGARRIKGSELWVVDENSLLQLLKEKDWSVQSTATFIEQALENALQSIGTDHPSLVQLVTP